MAPERVTTPTVDPLDDTVAANPRPASARDYSIRFSDDLESVPDVRGPMTGVLLADRYRLGRLLGEGGMGYVYEAVHEAIDKKFAVKVLAQEMCSHPAHVERFLREAKTTSKIDHDNIVEISDCGPTPDGSVFFVMEYLDGEDLGSMIDREGPQRWERTRHLMLQLCEAISAAHAQGIVHRDIKPQNCFRTTRRRDPDFLKVLDFGIAKLLGEEHVSGRKLTRTGQIFGTPEYMSPEQIRGMPADPRMDIYAAGVIMYELLVGKTPFVGEAPLEVLAKHIHDPVPGIDSTSVDTRLAKQIDAVIAGALAKDAALRFQTADDLAAAIVAVESAGATQRVPESASLDSMPITLTGVRRRDSPSNSVVGIVAAVVLAAICIGVAAIFVPGWLRQMNEGAQQPSGTDDDTPVSSEDARVAETAPTITPRDEPNQAEPATTTPVDALDAAPQPPPDADPVDDVKAGTVAASDPPRVEDTPTQVASTALKPRTPDADVEKRLRSALKGSCIRVDFTKWDSSETVTVSLTLQRTTGKVTKVSAKHSGTEEKISGCVVKKVSALKFPEGREGGRYTVTLRSSG